MNINKLDFYFQVHYKGMREQNESIRRVLSGRGQTVCATSLQAGAIFVDNGNIKLLGDVKKFDL